MPELQARRHIEEINRPMRRVLIAVLILLLPTAIIFVFYYLLNPKPIPTRRDAIGEAITIAGNGSPGVEDGNAQTASFSDPFGIAVDSAGNVYVADGGESNRIRKIGTDGKVETIAGSSEGFADGDRKAAQFNTPSGICIDRRGNIIIADTSNNRIRKIDTHGQVSTLAGSGAAGLEDGPADKSLFDGPTGVASDREGNVYVADTYNDAIRKIFADGRVSTIAGGGGPGYREGPAAEATFDTPCGIAVDREGNLFVADTGNHRIRKITPQGEVATIAGGIRGRADGPAAEAQFDTPVSLAVTHDGFLFVADHDGGRIRRITPEGEVSTYAGSMTGHRDGAGAKARFNSPAAVAVDTRGNVYVADSKNYLVRIIVPKTGEPSGETNDEKFIQPATPLPTTNADSVVPHLDRVLTDITSFPWPLAPQGEWHEIAGVVGEARGAYGGVALDHLHSGLDIRGAQGDAVLSVMDEKVSSPIANWDEGGTGEGIHVGLMSYIHIRLGRNAKDENQRPDLFEMQLNEEGGIFRVRVRRGTRFRVGDFLGTLNRLNHVHLNLGPWNAQANPIRLPLPGFKDTIAPTIEPDGIEVASSTGEVFKRKTAGRLVISGDVDIVLTAYDRVEGNLPSRKLGVYKAGYQILKEDGSAVHGFEEPLINIEFDRLPPGNESVFMVYAEGSGVSAYGTPTKFRYIVTNRVRDGRAEDGLLRTSNLAEGNYTIRVIAEDYAGNRTTGEIAVAIAR